jgi:hypothetical protein
LRKWSGKFKDLRGWYDDAWSDFCTTINEVAGQRTALQIIGVTAIVVFFSVIMVILWGVLSFLLALPVWGLWNVVASEVGIPQINYMTAYCLTFLCAILFRGNSVHLKE